MEVHLYVNTAVSVAGGARRDLGATWRARGSTGEPRGRGRGDILAIGRFVADVRKNGQFRERHFSAADNDIDNVTARRAAGRAPVVAGRCSFRNAAT